jgi:hypothetical protein
MNLSKLGLVFLGMHGLSSAQQVCSEIEDDQERLACYDAGNRTAAPGSQREAPAPAEELASPPTSESSSPVEARAPEQFGTKESEEEPKEYIEGTIVKIEESANRHYLLLDNGQVWREIEDSTLRFKEGRKVTITEGILNSYDLKMEGQNKIVKVKRLK